MKYPIVEALNAFLDNSRKKANIDIKGMFVLQESRRPSEFLKAYKRYNIVLWYKDASIKRKVITVELMEKVINDDDSVAVYQIQKELISKIYEFIYSGDFEKLVLGQYGSTNQ